MIDKHLINFAGRMRGYLENIKTKLIKRNECRDEYLRAKLALEERKLKHLALDRTQWKIDVELCETAGVEVELARADPSVARCFVFADVG